MPRYEPCPICNTPVLIREDGNVSTHLNALIVRSEGTDESYCPGSNQPYLVQDTSTEAQS